MGHSMQIDRFAGGSAGAASSAPGGRDLRRIAATSAIGTSIEFYDFFIFATAAAIAFPHVFFPADISPLVALISSFSTFAIGFVARPIGGMVFGHFGDRLGRKRMLALSMLLMGGATTLIGLLPSYALIGNAAPLLLILLRLVQGFALGGQWGGAVLIIIEDAPASRRGWYGAFAQIGAPIGTILANLAFLIVSATTTDDSFLAWGWRLPFIASVALVAVSFFVHWRLEETSAFEREVELKRERAPSPLVAALKQYPRAILTAAGVFAGMQTSYYLLVSFSLAYGTDPAGGGLSKPEMLTAVLVGTTAMIPGIFGGAWLSDRHGRRIVVGVAAALLGLWVFAEFPLIASGSLGLAILGLCIGQFFNGVIFGPLAALFAESFPVAIRYSGMSLAYQFGTLAGGAVAPLAATALFAHYASSLPISIYAALMLTLSVIAARAIRETASKSIAP